MNLLLSMILCLTICTNVQAPVEYLHEDVCIYENVNERIEWTDLMLSDICLPEIVYQNVDRYVEHIIIEPKITEKEMCETHNVIHKSFDELDDTCIDIQFYERDYSKLNSVYVQFKDGTGYYWEK